MSTKNIWKSEKPLKILAPMAGYTDAAFRVLCREFGADIVMTELISADAIAYTSIKYQVLSIKYNRKKYILNNAIANKNKPTAELLSFFEEERPIVVQLFGKYPGKFGAASLWITQNMKPDGIDINMGCPARKVVGSDHGAALLKNSDLAVEIIKAVKANTDLPVSVKTRLGWENDDEILEFAPKLVDAGIDSIMIHGRTYKDGFAGDARWENIYKIKEMFGDRISVIGNGDLKTVDSDQLSVIRGNKKITLDGIAIGRAAFGKPWIFQNQKSKIKNQNNGVLTRQDSYIRTNLQNIIRKHATLVFESKGERGIIEFRKHLLAYLKGFPNAKELRKMAVSIQNLKDIENIINLLKKKKGTVLF